MMDFKALGTAYTGAAAAGYDARRAPTAKWLGEDNAVGELIQVLPTGARILDMPVGTGRFLKLYHERGLKVVGRDISPDMLQAARAKRDEVGGLRKLYSADDQGGFDCVLELGNIQSISDEDGTYDCVLSSRFLNWVDAQRLEDILEELNRVSKRYLVVGIRHRVPIGDLISQGPPGFQRLATGYLLKFRRTVRALLRYPQPSPPHTIQHDRSQLLRIFRHLKLRIDTRLLVEHGRDGTDYYFYRLVRDAPHTEAY